MRKEEKAPEGPQRIGPYQVVTLVYRSPFNEVYCCREVRLDRNVAVKVTRLDDANRATASSRLRREALIRSTIEHANILPLYRAGRSRWGSYLAGAWLLGGTLLDRYGSLRPEAYVSLTREIGSALDRLHSAGWIHGDLNGRNIVFGGDGRAVLIDFGSVRHIGSRNGGETGLDITPEVVPPEVWRGEPADGRSDLYGLGVLLYRSMTGRYPFEGDEWPCFPEQHCDSPVPFPSGLNSAIGPRVESVLLRAMEKNPKERFRTGEEMAAELSRAVAADAGLKEDGSAARSQSLPRAGGARLEPGLGAETVRAAGAQLERFAGNLSDREQEALRALLDWLQEARAKATSEVSALTTKLFVVPAALLALEQIGASEVLADGATTPEELAAACGAPRSTTTCLLEVLAAAELLGVSGDRYSLPPPLGLLYQTGKRLGTPSRPIQEAADFWSWLPDWARTRQPYLAMDRPDGYGYSPVVELLASLVGEPARQLAGYLRSSDQLRQGAAILDVGAGSAVWSLAAAAGDPEATVTAVDRPAVLKIARARAESAGLGARFESLEGDWRTVPLPSEAFDLVLVANLCHLEPGEEVAVLLRRLRPPLRPGGLLVIVDTIPEKREEAPLTILLTGLRLALRTPRGGIHDLESYRRWLKAAAFSVQELLPLLPDEHFFALIACPSPRD